MRWIDEDGTERERNWVEPLDPRTGAADASALCPASERFVWAVPTQEGFALQLNSLLSVLALAHRLARVAVLMPLLATGPHYRDAVATRKIRPYYRMDRFVNVSASLAKTPYAATAFVHFDDVAGRLPSATPCYSCAGRPPKHVRCARGWGYEWCDRGRARRSRKARCAILFGVKSKDCGYCVFSAGFTRGVQLAEPDWKVLRSAIIFHDRYERGAAAVVAELLGSAAGRPYVAFHMRRGDKSRTLDKAGLTVDRVLAYVAGVAGRRPVVVATDDRSPATLRAVTARGFAYVDGDALRRLAPDAADPIGAYLVDILICAGATRFIGTATADNKSKQSMLIKALRVGRGHDAKKDIVLERLPKGFNATAR